MNNQLFAVMVEATPQTINGRETRYQVAFIESEAGMVLLHRHSNGGRGVSNAWSVAGSMNLDTAQRFTTEPMAITISDKQAEIAGNLLADPTGALPSNTLSELSRQNRVELPGADGSLTEKTLSLLYGEIEIARIERETLSTWVRGEQEPEVAKEPKEKVIWRGGGASITAEYELPEQHDSLVAWATLSVPDKTSPDYLRYVERTIAGHTLTQWFDHAKKGRKAVVISGPAGAGKTSAAYFYAGLNDQPLTIVECNTQMDNSVIQGKYVPTGNGNELTWRYSALATAITKPGVVLLNEVSRMTPKANALFMKLLAEKELIIDTHHNETLKLHPECLIVADANPNYRGTMLPDEAFLDRFLVKLEFDYDTEIEAKFIPSESLLELASELRRASNVEGKFSVPISTRLLLSFIDVALDLGYEAAVYNFVNAFPPAEREPLRMLFSTYEENISEELANVEQEVGA
jgi:hypothetical protein